MGRLEEEKVSLEFQVVRLDSALTREQEQRLSLEKRVAKLDSALTRLQQESRRDQVGAVRWKGQSLRI